MALPLFVCHANCCRSVLGQYLYEHLCGSQALSAGVEVGDEINDRAAAMLQSWGIDARHHRPRRIDRSLCDQAAGIFLMGPEYLRRLLAEHGSDLAGKSYLFANPFTVPQSFDNGGYHVYDPSFDDRPIAELVAEFTWFTERVRQVHRSLSGQGPALIPASRYLPLLQAALS